MMEIYLSPSQNSVRTITLENSSFWSNGALHDPHRTSLERYTEQSICTLRSASEQYNIVPTWGTSLTPQCPWQKHSSQSAGTYSTSIVDDSLLSYMSLVIGGVKPFSRDLILQKIARCPVSIPHTLTSNVLHIPILNKEWCNS